MGYSLQSTSTNRNMCIMEWLWNVGIHQPQHRRVFQTKNCLTKRAPRLRFAARGELPDPRTNAEDRRWGWQAPMRLLWAIQPSWTNGARLRLARPICGTLRSQAVSHALAFSWLDSFAVPAPAQVSPSGTMSQTVGLLILCKLS